MCFLFHKWGRWEFYTEYYTGAYIFGKNAGQSYERSENRQRRMCEKCGFTQDKEV